MPTLLKHTVFNELSNARNTNNMNILQVMFNYDKEVAPASLAGVFIDLLMMKECYLRALRALLREIVRFLRFDINLHIFCVNLMQLPVSEMFEYFLKQYTVVYLWNQWFDCWIATRLQTIWQLFSWNQLKKQSTSKNSYVRVVTFFVKSMLHNILEQFEFFSWKRHFILLHLVLSMMISRNFCEKIDES